jgi:hypothetical protein
MAVIDMRKFILVAVLLGATPPAWTQDGVAVNPEIASCAEIRDEATQTQAEICSTYLPCKMVFSLQQSCTNARRFLTRLQTSIGEGVKTLFGRRKEATAAAVFDATLSDVALRAGQSEEWKALSAPVSASVAKAGDTVLQGKDGSGAWVYAGDARNGQANGAGTMVTSAGEVRRGSFKDGKLDGAAEVASVDGQRKIGSYAGGLQTGYGMNLLADGRRFTGTYKNGAMVEGTLYRADGSKLESGAYRNGELEVGQRFNERGEFLSEVNQPRDRFLAARVPAPQPAVAQVSVPASSSVSDDPLKRMSAGELFSRADELREAGDNDGAQKSLRALVARFPDHELGKLAAERIAKGWHPAGSKIAAASGKTAIAGGADASGRCKAALQALDAEQQKLQQRIRPQGAVPGMRFAMLLMQQYLAELDRSCAGAPEVAALRADMEKSYKATETACNQMASITCTPAMN